MTWHHGDSFFFFFWGGDVVVIRWEKKTAKHLCHMGGHAGGVFFGTLW